ncbi:MAG: hypothetical protein HY804_02670 [Nitrospinae bacterium]|nr:hypothetical protein [Nitrospinota bacterium]
MDRLNLHAYDKRRIGRQSQFRQVFALKMQGQRFLNIFYGFIQCGSLRHNRQADALGDIAAFIARIQNDLYYVPFHIYAARKQLNSPLPDPAPHFIVGDNLPCAGVRKPALNHPLKRKLSQYLIVGSVWRQFMHDFLYPFFR